VFGTIFEIAHQGQVQKPFQEEIMRDKKVSTRSALVLTMFAATILLTGARAAAQTESVLLNFNGRDGEIPEAGLIFDAAGNLYGTTAGGGTGGDSGHGTVFELTPNGSGGWTQKVLHTFHNTGNDGFYLYDSLVMDAAGNLYGTTFSGGANGAGTVFELTRNTSGDWTEKQLHSFSSSGTDGYGPYGNLIFDAAGNLYGTTFYGGGTRDDGTVFELMPVTGGKWKEKILLSFNGGNGAMPIGGLLFDAAGNLYGTASNGGSSDLGTVFKLTPSTGGAWRSTVLYNFDNYDGEHPAGGLILDVSGNLYGTTGEGGSGFGTVFELKPAVGGGWTESVLSQFDGGTEGGYPCQNLIFDSAGNLYGTTNIGGANNYGTVFELTPGAGGAWTETVLYSFRSLSGGADGYSPAGGVVRDAAGNLYGTTTAGGTHEAGTVFELTP
jgi:uncharacterized repeat protein (TIGR03803 family)